MILGITSLENFYVGTDQVEKIYFGTDEVWSNVPPFSATWSGSSLAGGNQGVLTSGSSHRLKINTFYGNWATSYTDGTFSNTSSAVSFGYGISQSIYSGGAASTSSSQLRFEQTPNGIGGFISFTIGGGFTGSSLVSGLGLEASGGLLRFKRTDAIGGWISLT